MIITKVLCDVCKGVCNEKDERRMDVIFHTDQNEGLSCTPYLSTEKLHLCHKCLNRIVTEGKYIHGNGAMGNNTYFWKEE